MTPPAALPRRPLLGLAMLGGLAVPAGAQPATLRFRILREGSQIGTHQVIFSHDDAGLTARSVVEIAVKLVGITVFRFDHRQEEVWAGDRLRRATSHQDRNGRVQDMTARAEAGAVVVQGTAGAFRLPPEAAPLTWWDAHRPGRPLFDSSSGKPLAVTWTRVAQPDGGVLFTASGDAQGAAGYGPDGTWRSFRTRGDDNSLVVYEPA